MIKISCLIIDDGFGSLNVLDRYIKRCTFLKLGHLHLTTSEAIELLKENSIDIIFMELNNPKLQAFTAARVVPPLQKFVFITDEEQYAPTDLSDYTVDYLTRSSVFNRFLISVEKVSTTAGRRLTDDESKSIFVKSGGQMVRVSFSDIIYIKGEKEYVSLQFANSRLLIFKRMKEMENLLPQNFIRIHVSYIINTDYISSMSGDHLIIKENRIPISKTYRRHVKLFLKDWLI